MGEFKKSYWSWIEFYVSHHTIAEPVLMLTELHFSEKVLWHYSVLAQDPGNLVPAFLPAACLFQVKYKVKYSICEVILSLYHTETEKYIFHLLQIRSN